jgi:hypothetical protein
VQDIESGKSIPWMAGSLALGALLLGAAGVFGSFHLVDVLNRIPNTENQARRLDSTFIGTIFALEALLAALAATALTLRLSPLRPACKVGLAIVIVMFLRPCVFMSLSMFAFLIINGYVLALPAALFAGAAVRCALRAWRPSAQGERMALATLLGVACFLLCVCLGICIDKSVALRWAATVD